MVGNFGSVCTKAVKNNRELAVPLHDAKNWNQIKKRGFRKLMILRNTVEFHIHNRADVSIMGDGLMQFLQMGPMLRT